MKIALGMIVKDEQFFLERHLPIIAPHFEHIIAIDAESNDGTIEILQKHGAKVFNRPWNNNFGEARSYCVSKAEEEECDWLFMLDADECMFPEDIVEAKSFMNEDNTFLLFPRVEFQGNAEHFNSRMFPDCQGRAVKLRLGYHWKNLIHEIVYRGNKITPETEYTVVPGAMIFHYGWALDFERRFARYYPGQPITNLLDNPEVKRYAGRQPI